MARPYSTDLRDRVVASVAAGRTLPGDGGAVWGERCQRGEVVAAVSGDGERGGRVGWAGIGRVSLAGERDWLLARLAEKPDLTLRALVAELAERGVAASYGAVWRFLQARGDQRSKKSLYATEQDRPDVARRRARWKKYQGQLDPRRLVFIDETWAKTNMTRLRGRCAARRSVWSPRCRTAAGAR